MVNMDAKPDPALTMSGAEARRSPGETGGLNTSVDKYRYGLHAVTQK